MKIAYISDMHLEFLNHTYQEVSEEYLEHFNNLEVDRLVIAGDLHSKWKVREKFLDKIKIPYVFIEGNHDYFGIEPIDNFFDDGVICGATLWSSLYGMAPNALDGWWDFRWIPEWTTEKCQNMFYKQRDQIFDSPSEIVVTHFVPTMQAITPKYKGDPYNSYFCSNLDDLIKNSNKKLWIFGHNHSQWDFMIGGCRMVSNQIGYPNELNVPRQVKVIEI